jgi:hydroxymethylbilane synthase
VAERIRQRAAGVDVELVRIRTSGDRETSRPLYDVGGKGLFTKEIDEALLAGEVDAGVHSMKDVPAALPAGLAIAAVPGREDPRDVLVARTRGGLGALPRGARVGTSSLRRRALVRHARPDVDVVDLRGNVETRLAKWRRGEIDGTLLAAAGLRRLGIELDEAEPLPAGDFVPAIGQGALAVEAAPGTRWWALLASLDEPDAARAVAAERAFLRAVGGDCKTPIAAHARVAGGALELAAVIADPDGERLVRGEVAGRVEEAESLGLKLGEDLLERGGRDILSSLAEKQAPGATLRPRGGDR